MGRRASCRARSLSTWLTTGHWTARDAGWLLAASATIRRGLAGVSRRRRRRSRRVGHRPNVKRFRQRGPGALAASPAAPGSGGHGGHRLRRRGGRADVRLDAARSLVLRPHRQLSGGGAPAARVRPDRRLRRHRPPGPGLAGPAAGEPFAPRDAGAPGGRSDRRVGRALGHRSAPLQPGPLQLRRPGRDGRPRHQPVPLRHRRPRGHTVQHPSGPVLGQHAVALRAGVPLA